MVWDPPFHPQWCRVVKRSPEEDELPYRGVSPTEPVLRLSYCLTAPHSQTPPPPPRARPRTTARARARAKAGSTAQSGATARARASAMSKTKAGTCTLD